MTDTLFTITDSPITFKVYERPLFFTDRRGKLYPTKSKALVRLDENNNPISIAEVNKTYKVIQNYNLFSMIEKSLIEVMGELNVLNCHIKDKSSHNGKYCMREYLFTNQSSVTPDGNKFNFRVIALNSFGGTSVKVFVGAIDFFCTNGVITGEYNTEVMRHTSKADVSKFSSIIKSSVEEFGRLSENMQILADTPIAKVQYTDTDTGLTTSYYNVLEFLEKHFSKKLAAQIFEQFYVEVSQRQSGASLWSLYSAMTYYASHPDFGNGLKKSSIDNAAYTMLQREQFVAKLVKSKDFLSLGAASH
jgi:hypothetical protein